MEAAWLAVAHAAADAADKVLAHYWDEGVDVRLKGDASPVTLADEEAEAAIRAVICAAFPEHGFYGEEGEAERTDAEFVWLVDPLDGTKSFIRRLPFYSTQIALLRNGQRVLGVSNAPRFAERTHAVVGGGAWMAGERLHVSATEAIGDASLSTGNLRTLAASDGWLGFGDLVARVNRIRGYGDFFHYHQLAAGRLDAVLESDVNILDIAALATVVEEAGGRVTDLYGEPIRMASTSVLATNGLLHDEILEALWN
ncbi:MAG: inositol monophosphatase family protein [Gammaproteobacteria bacterium]